MYNNTLGSALNSVRSTRSLRVLTLLILAVSVLSACSTAPKQQSGDVVVNAPADGVVRRVLVAEGVAVNKDAAIVEIAVELDQPITSQRSTPSADQTNALRSAETDLASAEGEANRTAGEVRRIEPLVRRGLASQAELDKARTQSQDAQDRVRLARDRVATAKESLNPPKPATPTETLIAVRVPAAGTVRTLSVHAGQAVKSGQPIATLGQM